jgi:hypothetical protein
MGGAFVMAAGSDHTKPTRSNSRERNRLIEESARLSEALECCNRRLRLDHAAGERSAYEVYLIEDRERLSEALECCKRRLTELESENTLHAFAFREV